MMSEQQSLENCGFDCHSFIKKIKDELNLPKVRVYYDNPNSQAMSRYTDNEQVLEIHLPTIQTIRAQKPDLSNEEAVAKVKSAIIEEHCHGKYHETDHNAAVVGCTLSTMEKHLTPAEINYPYIQEKVQRLKQAEQTFKGTPIG